MRKSIAATICLLGLISTNKASAVSYTHNLIYTAKVGDNNATLTGTVTFETTDPNAQTDFTGAFGGASAIDRDLVTNVTFTYTPDGGAATSLSNADVTGFLLDHTNNGSTDYDGNPTLFSQLTNLQFYSTGGNFELAINNTAFEVQAGVDDDFTLTSTTYHSPSPLPLLALFASTSYIKKLKDKYKKKYSL